MATTVNACPSCGTKNRVPAEASGRPRCASCQTDLPWLATSGDHDFDAVVTESPLPVLVDCWAEWCGPCRTVSPIVEAVAGERAGRLKVVKVDVDANPAVAQRLGVQGIPALFLFRDGAVVDQQVGAAPKTQIDQWLDQAGV